ncbi:glycosyltransferase [Methanofollis formosanus]|uniref:Glycosyltransferase n=1 Tax=Methanofollis formosanus TaxID=299308 RepID=A0A8G1EFT7_9EURY|nr:glycosyltransferase family 4 protein [Methanofollis formosanus]QYZ78451.1 glycosyltransferase [Methanofollis formosanus]
MKILQVISSFPPAYSYGGAVKVSYEVSKELTKRGHEVTVFTTDTLNSQSRINESVTHMEGINICRFRNLSNNLAAKNLAIAPGMALSLRKIVKEFDVVHIHEYRSFQAIATCHYAKKYNIPYVLQPHGSLPRIIEKKGQKKFYDEIWGNRMLKDASQIVAVSRTEAEQFKQVGIPDEKITVILNGFDVRSFTDLPPAGQFREQYDIHQKHVILYVGRIHKRKGIDFLIRAFHSFLQTWTGDDVALVIVGPEDGYRSVLENLVEQLGIPCTVKFIGYISSLEAAYRDADVLVYPSIYEIFGLVPFEALLCGTPVIVTDDCGCGEIIEEAGGGYLVRYGDVAGLSETLRSALEHSDVNRKMVEVGRWYIEEYLVWKKIVKQVEAMYGGCIQ